MPHSKTNSTVDGSRQFEGEEYDAIVIGAGFAGLYAVHKLRDQLGLSVRAFDVASDVGGTWFWNRYPGARCDIESFHYSYSFSEELQQEWKWSERFAGQPEILKYLNHVADRFDLRRNIQFNARIVSAVFDETASRWDVTTDTGVQARAQFIISGAGNLSVAKDLEFPGRETFTGEVYSTGAWPHEGVDFTGKRVGVIGTGASGIQVIPEIAKQAAHLTVFQRTPNYATPIANAPMDDEFENEVKSNYREYRTRSRNHFLGVPYNDVQPSALAVSEDDRRRTYEERWKQGGFRLFTDSFGDLLVNKDANDTVAEFVRMKIHERVSDPKVADLLAPKDYPYGTKRPPLETDYYEAYNRDNVTLVDIKGAPITAIIPTGIKTADGGAFELDVIVLAVGFDAMTGPLLNMGIVGRQGLKLTDKWEDGPLTYLGLTINGFPNLFLITGPQSPSVLYNMPLAIEDHVDFSTDAIRYMRERGMETIEPTAEAEQAWVEGSNAIAEATLLPGTDSWYMGANIPGKPRKCLVYLGGAPTYRGICDEVVAKDYDGFVLAGAESNSPLPVA
jgi:cation diffusion facilitator CzcD-associated flavoprotein CzcO